MDDRRFDAFAKSLATGASRRSLLKGLLGVGSVATVGALRERDADAARRPTPTPKPVTCPGRQTWNGSRCVCPPNLTNCGPDCCTENAIPAPLPGHSECCDNACCFGTCYGEELCCATNNRAGGLPPSHQVCEGPDGPSCCRFEQECCLLDGCCDTVCYGGSVGASTCCAEQNFCPGGSETAGICCESGETCCGAGTNANTCVDLSVAGGCCDAADCDSPPPGSTPCATGVCTGNVCSYTDCDDATEVCCPDNAGRYACREGGECCLSSEDCADFCNACVGYVCVDDPITFPCGPENNPTEHCCPNENFSLCCGASQFDCCGVDAAAGVTRECDADGGCCPVETPYFCAGSETCCANACTVIGERELCCPAGNLSCGTGCCDPATHRCCQGRCVPIADPCCSTNDDCGACQTCNPGSGTCSSLCTVSAPQCCVNGFGEYCVPGNAICCDGPEDCAGPCSYCNDVVRICLDRCSRELPICCESDFGDYCIADGSICCTSDDQCPGDPAICTVGVCLDGVCGIAGACQPFQVCCGDGGCADGDPRVGECCTSSDCLEREGCQHCVDHLCVPGCPPDETCVGFTCTAVDQ